MEKRNEIVKKKRKISFLQLATSSLKYSLEEKLLVLEWMYSAAKDFRAWNGRYNYSGFDQLIHDYSANDRDSNTAINGSSSQLELIFYRALFKEATENIERFRNEFGIKPGKSKFLTLTFSVIDEVGGASFNLRKNISLINDLSGKFFKEDFCSEDMRGARILRAKFACGYGGFCVYIDYTWEKYKNSRWTEEYRPLNAYDQNAETEPLALFVERISNMLKNGVTIKSPNLEPPF